ncbi:MAG: exodeoxyribonuclease VII small subunit [Burkholderiaceae bacterium]
MARSPSNSDPVRPPATEGGSAVQDASGPASFETVLAELEGIVEQMETGALSLEQSLAAYKRGAELVGVARKALTDVEQQVRILEADVLKPFESGDAES